MSHFKTLFVSLLILTGSHAWAASNIFSLYSCNNALTQAGATPNRFINHGYSERPFYIIDKEVTKDSFLIFNDHAIYRCNLPKENAVLSLWSSCRFDSGKTESWHLEMRVGEFIGFSLRYERENKEPYRTVNVANSWTSLGKRPEGKWCKISCREELTPENTRKVADQIAAQVNTVYDTSIRKTKSKFTEIVNGCPLLTSKAQCEAAAKEVSTRLGMSLNSSFTTALATCWQGGEEISSLTSAELNKFSASKGAVKFLPLGGSTAR